MFVPLVNVVRKGRRRDEKLIGLARLSLAGQNENEKQETKTKQKQMEVEEVKKDSQKE